MKKNYIVPKVSLIKTEDYELLVGTGAGSDIVESENSITNPIAGSDVRYGEESPEDEIPRARKAFDFFE